MPKRLVILASGNGSNLQAIIDACAAQELTAEVVAVITNKASAYALERAKQAHIPSVVQESQGEDRRSYDQALAESVAAFQPDWIILAGWMRLLSNVFLNRFPQQVINLHPALPGTYPGIKAIERAFADYQAGLIQHTGVMVHFVPDEGVDDGPVLATAEVAIYPTDTLEQLAERMHATERKLLLDTLQKLIQAA